MNTKGENAEQVPAQLVHFLRYVENSTDECAAREQNTVVEALHKRVNALKKSREWERRYMTFGELLQEAKQEGHVEGHAEGQQRMLTLIAQMTQAGDDELIPRLAEDASFLEEMYQKYHLKSCK